MNVRLASFANALALIAVGCATTGGEPRPEFSQRAAPREGQDEIELLAGIEGRLVISDGCLGVERRIEGKVYFSTVVWPWNARLEQVSGRWQVMNTRSGESIRLGEKISGGGGRLADMTAEELRLYNRFLTRDLSAACAAKGFVTLNRNFRPG